MNVAPRPVVAVACSGGRDSTALLHATVRGARALGLKVVALHVHHGLNPAADEWQQHLQAQCGRWRRAGWPVQLRVTRLAGTPGPGESVEAWARRERYLALERMAVEEGATLILLAHHRRDQAETVLLQALRGAGVRGLAAMPARAERTGRCWARPWLGQGGQAIADYVRRHRLSHIEDDSNRDGRFARNRLRLAVWPHLEAAFPSVDTTLGAVAGHAARALAVVDELAAVDLVATVDAEGGLQEGAWRALSAARRWFCLQAWLRPQLPTGVPDALVDRLTQELPGRRVGRWPVSPEQELRLYRGRLQLVQVRQGARSLTSPPSAVACVFRHGGQTLAGWGGVARLAPVASGGLSPAVLAGAEWRPRQGGEQFQARPDSVPRSLKKQFQAAGIAAWQREGPLLWLGDRLLWVPGLGVDARARAEPGQLQYVPVWSSDD